VSENLVYNQTKDVGADESTALRLLLVVEPSIQILSTKSRSWIGLCAPSR
jgi:hypothetical protein